MTEKTQPTDVEIEALGHRMCWRYKHDTGVNHISTFTFNAQTLHDFARAVLAHWGQPSEATAPVAPDFYTACAWNDDRGEGRWIAIPGYSDVTEHGVKNRVLEVARKEGYKGTATGRLMELGWEIRPVYLSAPPPQAARKVFLVATGEEHEGEATYTRYDDAPPPLCDSECLYTAAPTPRAARKQDRA